LDSITGKLNSNTYYDGWEDAASTSLQTNTWYHGAVVYERTAGTNSGFHTLYLNGAVDLARTAREYEGYKLRRNANW
jgi:hypothetical protein